MNRATILHDKRKVPYSPIDTLIKDQYKHINVYIVTNKKPTNKFTLYAVGYSIFLNQSKPLIKFPNQHYVSGIHEEHANIHIPLKDAPTEKELLNWYNKNKSKIMDLTEHEQLEKEYEEALTLSKNRSWQILYLENQKHYYENHVYQGKDSPEYKEILAKLKSLS
jgi:hypothetical protein